MLTEDFSVFTDPVGLGDTAIVGAGTIDGIFSREYVEVGNIEGYYPTFLVSNVDAATITKKSTVLTLASVGYTAISKRPDGTGATLLVLEKQ